MKRARKIKILKEIQQGIEIFIKTEQPQYDSLSALGKYFVCIDYFHNKGLDQDGSVAQRIVMGLHNYAKKNIKGYVGNCRVFKNGVRYGKFSYLNTREGILNSKYNAEKLKHVKAYINHLEKKENESSKI